MSRLGSLLLLLLLLSSCSHVRLCATLWIAARQAPLFMGFSRQEYCWSGLPSPPPGLLSDSGVEPAPLVSPALAGGFFITSTTREARDYPTAHFISIPSPCFTPLSNCSVSLITHVFLSRELQEVRGPVGVACRCISSSKTGGAQ